ncbi:unnamed protein product [Prunus armeniaca]|uniref:Uncharacterized protein n=1 Tax=Prunus armeniaca TaxID=36596 RepID=A0A6J5TX57_PRUAR|nr:unnamed protein product [Prunus armeniaca]
MGGGGVDCFFTRWRDVYWVRLGGGDVGTGSVRFGGSGRISGGCDDDGLTIMAMDVGCRGKEGPSNGEVGRMGMAKWERWRQRSGVTPEWAEIRVEMGWKI